MAQMTNETHTQRWLIVHGAIVFLVALALGIPSVIEVTTQTGRMWQAAHSALLILGIWMIATAAITPLLTLAAAEASGLKWSLVAAGYSFMTAVVLQAITGVRAFSMEGTIATKIAFLANLVAVLSSFLAASLTLVGASNALREVHRANAGVRDKAGTPDVTVHS
jgi:hypothetical protein